MVIERSIKIKKERSRRQLYFYSLCRYQHESLVLNTWIFRGPTGDRQSADEIPAITVRNHLPLWLLPLSKSDLVKICLFVLYSHALFINRKYLIILM